MAKHYLIIKNNNNEMCYINYEALDGFTFKPLNSIDYDNGVIVAKMVIFKPEFIEKILTKKIKRKLNQYLEFILSTVDEDDECSDADNVKTALNDLIRYRQLIINKYGKYLDAKFLKILLTKISMLEDELKNRLVALLYGYEEYEEVQEHRRSR